MSNSFYWDKLWTEVQRYLGLDDLLTKHDFDTVRTIVDSGVHQFVYPPPHILSNAIQHVWSFLKPIASGTLESGEEYYDLPDDFASINSDVYVNEGPIRQIQYVSVERMRMIASQHDYLAESYPRYFALIDTTEGQKLWFWPKSNDDIEIYFRYEVQPDIHLEASVEDSDTMNEDGDEYRIDSATTAETAEIGDRIVVSDGDSIYTGCVTNVDSEADETHFELDDDETLTGDMKYRIFPKEPFDFGKKVHQETIVESCLAIAEQRQEDIAALHTQVFTDRLLPASITRDKAASAPTKMGNEFEGGKYPRGAVEFDLTWNGEAFN